MVQIQGIGGQLVLGQASVETHVGDDVTCSGHFNFQTYGCKVLGKDILFVTHGEYSPYGSVGEWNGHLKNEKITMRKRKENLLVQRWRTWR